MMKASSFELHQPSEYSFWPEYPSSACSSQEGLYRFFFYGGTNLNSESNSLVEGKEKNRESPWEPCRSVDRVTDA